ncbi:LysR family transcriptional regulator [Alteromonas macleodii]|uniref:LysR family transcriptional regulator n=1 Tax=Alteromonas macleodii TaxID=28108 RepID=UPI002076A2FC|nr:LysR family transcriptional regulator [Alteromonas macleodii]USI26539.1 LysR family transcriptional regulator [Alteromonas macleodii]
MDTASRLLLFLDVVEHGSLMKAAESRKIDRSVVSKQISKLEDDLGVRLLNRTTRSISLTAAGGEMIKKASELRMLMQDTFTVAENFHSEPNGLLRIAAAPLIGRRYLQPVINQFQKDYPQVDIELRLDSKVADVVSEGIDLAFRVGEPKDGSFIARRIAQNRMIIAAAPSFIKTYGMPSKIEDLMHLPAATFVSTNARIKEIHYFNKQGHPCTQPMKSVFSANDGEVLIMKTLTGDAYFAGPCFILSDEIAKGDLIPLVTNTHLAEYSGMYAVYPHRDLPKRTLLFFNAVREYIGEEVPIWESNIKDFDNMYRPHYPRA